MAAQGDAERIHTVVVGAGQAGLTTGYHLARRGIPFVILEAHPRVGDSWRRRWRSLRLFTPAAFDGLPGMPFPAPPGAFPTKDEMADYLEAYAARFGLPVRTGVRIDRLAREGGRLVLHAGDRRIEAENVIVAMATFQAPRVPPCAAALSPATVQLHSRDYRDPSQLRPGGVLVVGAGNSGAELAIETARAGHRTWLSGRDVGHIPIQIEPAGAATRLLLRFLFRVIFHRVLTVGTPIGRRARPRIVSHGGPLIRLKPADLAAAGVERVPRLADVRDGRPVLEDGRALDVENVVWCTGFHPGFSWIDLPVFGPDGEPAQDRGVVAREPGLYFVGLHYLYALSSTMIHGVGRDAEHVVWAIAARTHAAADPAASRPAGAAATRGPRSPPATAPVTAERRA